MPPFTWGYATRNGNASNLTEPSWAALATLGRGQQHSRTSNSQGDSHLDRACHAGNRRAERTRRGVDGVCLCPTLDYIPGKLRGQCRNRRTGRSDRAPRDAVGPARASLASHPRCGGGQRGSRRSCRPGVIGRPPYGCATRSEKSCCASAGNPTSCVDPSRPAVSGLARMTMTVGASPEGEHPAISARRFDTNQGARARAGLS